jgi:hypothetical protein
MPPTRPCFTPLYRRGTPGVTIPLGAGGTLRVIETRFVRADEGPVLVVKRA